MNELIRCYKQASIITNHVFYLPVRKDEEWYITRLLCGEQDTLTLDQFKDYIKTKPCQEETIKEQESFYVLNSSEVPVSDRLTKTLNTR